MKKFIKVTTREGDAYIRTWIDSESINQLSQNSVTQEGLNEGTCTFIDGTTIDIISFNETLSFLN